MAWPFASAGAHTPHSDETHDPTPTRESSHSARRLRSLAFLGSSYVGFFKISSRPLPDQDDQRLGSVYPVGQRLLDVGGFGRTGDQ